MSKRPSLLVTVDTEGDNEWVYARHPDHKNLEHLEPFERMLERVGARATYLVTYTVAKDSRASILRDLLKDDRCEIGAHCHAWNNPPVEEPEGAQVFLNELPADTQRQKLTILTDVIEEVFERRPTSFRGGRFGANADTLQILESLGYLVDSTVTPRISWRATPGLPGGEGGPDYRDAGPEPYRVDVSDPCRIGHSEMLQIPVTMHRTREIPWWLERRVAAYSHTGFVARVTKRLGCGRVLWFRPSFQTIEETTAAARLGIERNSSVFNMLLHSSELMPGGSPYASNAAEVNALLERTERALEFVLENANAAPRTLDECRSAILGHSPAGGAEGGGGGEGALAGVSNEVATSVSGTISQATT